jgi:flagellar motility protein MotE (MotC chaperone)
MMRFVRDLRLIPIALIASACLLALKMADLVLDSGYFFGADNTNFDSGEAQLVRRGPGTVGAPDSWAKQMFNFPDGKGPAAAQGLPQIMPRRANVGARENLDVTGSVTAPPPDGAKPDAAGAKDAKAEPSDPPPAPPGRIIPTEGPVPTGAERAILERLQQRREEIDTRARELDLRESLIQNAEKRMDSRIDELKGVESRIKTETEQKSQTEDARLKSLITIYENMKPRDAAKIFNGLEDNVLVEVAAKINPRTMAEILALMQADVAQRLTVELASKAQQAPQPGGGPGELPKIDGQPTAK